MSLIYWFQGNRNESIQKLAKFNSFEPQRTFVSILCKFFNQGEEKDKDKVEEMLVEFFISKTTI